MAGDEGTGEERRITMDIISSQEDVVKLREELADARWEAQKAKDMVNFYQRIIKAKAFALWMSMQEKDIDVGDSSFVIVKSADTINSFIKDINNAPFCAIGDVLATIPYAWQRITDPNIVDSSREVMNLMTGRRLVCVDSWWKARVKENRNEQNNAQNI